MARDMDLTWGDLDMQRFLLLSGAGVLSVRTILHPFSTVKTRLQVATTSTTFMPEARALYQAQGFRGFYRGFAASIVAVLPAQTLYIGVLEGVRGLLSPWWGADLLGGAAASASASLIGVPLDLVSQRQMALGLDARPTSRQLGAALVQIARTEGLRGLYRGYGATMLTYAPSSAVWWGTYAQAKRQLLPLLPSHALSLVPVLAGAMAATTACLVTQPLDTAKTRLQVQGRGNLFSHFTEVLRNEGFKGLYRGVGPRLTTMNLFALLSANMYEFVKRNSKKTPPRA